jgi:hypothetical protein
MNLLSFYNGQGAPKEFEKFLSKKPDILAFVICSGLITIGSSQFNLFCHPTNFALKSASSVSLIPAISFAVALTKKNNPSKFIRV